jgi:hypothetical protein
MGELMRLGWTKQEAAGAAGAAAFESGNRYGVVNSIGAAGLWQMLGKRRAGLINYAKSVGKPWWDPLVQAQWINLERTGGSVKYGGSDERAFYRRGLSGDAADYETFIERPGGGVGRGAVRSYARQAFGGYKPPEETAVPSPRPRPAGGPPAITHNYAPVQHITIQGNAADVERAIVRANRRSAEEFESTQRGVYADLGYGQ